MLKADVIAYFGSPARVAEALGISRAAVTKWPVHLPEGSAYKVESITERALRVDPADYPSRQTPQQDVAVAP